MRISDALTSITENMDIERLFIDRLHRIRPGVKAAFLTVLTLGFVVHIAAITGTLVNWDSLTSLLDDSHFLVAQGKWFFPVVHRLKGYLGAGSLAGPLAIFNIAVSAALTVSVLEIKKPLCCALTGGLMVTFMSVMCTFSYSGEDVFFFSLLLSALAVYCVVRYERGWLPGLVLLTLSLGTYQAFIGYAAGLCVLYCLCQLVYSEKGEREIVRKGLVMVGILLGSVAAYYIVLRLVLRFGDVSLSYYHGADTMTEPLDFGHIFTMIKSAPVKVIEFFRYDAFGGHFTSFRIMYIATLVIIALCGTYTIIRSRVYLRLRRLALEAIMIIILPLAVNVIAVLSQNQITHWIMAYPFVLIFILPVKLADARFELPVYESEKVRTPDDGRLVEWSDAAATLLHSAALLLTAALIFSWSVYTNHGYARMTMAYENVYARCESISGSVLDAYYAMPDDVRPDKPLVAITGKNWYPEPEDMFSYMDDYTGIANKDLLTSSAHYEYMIENYIGIDFDYIRASKVCDKEVLSAMPVYPAKGSVAVHDRVIIVCVC